MEIDVVFDPSERLRPPPGAGVGRAIVFTGPSFEDAVARVAAAPGSGGRAL